MKRARLRSKYRPGTRIDSASLVEAVRGYMDTLGRIDRLRGALEWLRRERNRTQAELRNAREELEAWRDAVARSVKGRRHG